MTTESLTKKITHSAEAQSRLLQTFQDSPNLKALIDVYAQQIQALEDVLFELLLERRIENAEGIQLDNIGTITGAVRGPLDDEDFRTVLAGRLRVIQGSGTAEDILFILNAGTFGDQVIELEEQFPAALVVKITDGLAPEYDGVIIARQLQLAKAAAVRAILEWYIAADGAAFAFDVGPGLDMGYFAAASEG